MTLRRGQQRDSSAGRNPRSEFVFIATPGSTSPGDTVLENPLVEEVSVEEVIVEHVNEEIVYEEPKPVSEEPALLCDGTPPIAEYAAEAFAEALVEDPPVVEEEPPVEEVCSADCIVEEAEGLEPEPDASLPGDYFGWGSFSSKKDKRKGKKRVQGFLEIIEELSPDTEPAFEDDGWGFWGAMSTK